MTYEVFIGSGHGIFGANPRSKYFILDGRNRLDASKAVGIKVSADKHQCPDVPYTLYMAQSMVEAPMPIPTATSSLPTSTAVISPPNRSDSPSGPGKHQVT